jgi:hypothetical protein
MGLTRFGVTGLFGVEPEGSGKQIGEGGGDCLAGGGGVEDGGVGRGELEDGLAAGSAGHAGGAVEVDYSDGADADGGAVDGDGGGDGGLLGAGGEAVGGVFYVGSGDDLAGFEEDGRAYAEAAVRGVGVLGGFGGSVVESGDFGGGEGGEHRGVRLSACGAEGKLRTVCSR